ncbi:UNVERIFIED_CONTAM: hypothetical protein Sindi_1267000, partial [Sesamum indicum]
QVSLNSENVQDLAVFRDFIRASLLPYCCELRELREEGILRTFASPLSPATVSAAAPAAAPPPIGRRNFPVRFWPRAPDPESPSDDLSIRAARLLNLAPTRRQSTAEDRNFSPPIFNATIFPKFRRRPNDNLAAAHTIRLPISRRTFPTFQFWVPSTTEVGLSSQPLNLSVVDSPSLELLPIADHRHSTRLLRANRTRQLPTISIKPLRRSRNSETPSVEHPFSTVRQA